MWLSNSRTQTGLLALSIVGVIWTVQVPRLPPLLAAMPVLCEGDAVSDNEATLASSLARTGPFADAALAQLSTRTLGESLAGAVVSLVFWLLSRRIRQSKGQEKRLTAIAAESGQKFEHEKDHVQELSRVKSQFVNNISHEIRTPMNGIVGALELALMTELTLEQREYLQLCKGSTHALMALLNDMLEFSRMELEKLEIERVDFTLAGCVWGAVTALQLAAEQKGLTLRIDLGADLPDRIAGDPAHIHQILVKLVDNAVKFSSEGEIVISVRGESSQNVPKRPEDGSFSLVFSVQDCGMGIPEAKLHAIFDPFQQGDGSLTRSHGGAGLGLAICKRLVRLVGGRLWVESEEGKGSRFCFTASFLPATHAGREAPHTEQTAQNEPGWRGRRQVLVVEDNQVNQLIALRLLEKRGYHCLVANNGRQALESVASASVDLVLMDIQMPEMDGFEATRCIRELEKNTGAHVPILAMTAHATPADRDACLLAGMDGHIAKPVHSDQLYQAIDAAFGASSHASLVES
jgi:signal transduction histidine kinase/ActR/RegA family two-component response regulator